MAFGGKSIVALTLSNRFLFSSVVCLMPNLLHGRVVACLLVALGWTSMNDARAQPADANYDEAKVPQYSLPDPLKLLNGEPVTDAETWRTKRRPEILRLYESEVFGRSPTPSAQLKIELLNSDERALGGRATRKQVRCWFNGRPDGPFMDLLIYLPNGGPRPAPLFLGLNFGGNQTIHADPGIAITAAWVPNDEKLNIRDHRATAATRGQASSRWAVEEILARGYGLATIYCGEIEPDHAGGPREGIHRLFFKPGQTEPGPDEWGTIGAWAWGLSRAVDYLQTDRDVDARRIALLGHSRLGKTALWAGAQDERFAIVISNNSGEGGAAITRRRYGESLRRINTSFPHWFCGNYKKYNDQEDNLPVDAHMLLALVAPRPVYVASAEDDRWADPRGEFLAAWHATPVYRLLGKDGLPNGEMPAVDRPIATTIGYHVRKGAHDVTDYDWEQYLNFADRHLGKPNRPPVPAAR